MEVTLGKVSWIVSILIFLFLLYNNDAVERVTTMAEDQVVIQYESQDMSRLAAEPEMEPLETIVKLGSGTMSIREAELYLAVERLSWKIELLDEQLIDMNIKIAKLTNDKDTITSNLFALLTTMMPLLIPVVTSKLGIHDKQIGRKK